MLEIIVGTIIWGSLHGALQENQHYNTAGNESPCEVQRAVKSELDPGKVLYWTCDN